MNKLKIIFSVLFLSVLFMASCKSDDRKKQTDKAINNSNSIKTDNPLKLLVSNETEKHIVGDIINISISESKISKTDTVILFIENTEVSKLTMEKPDFKWNTKKSKVGINNILIQLNKENNRFKSNKNIILYSDITPENYTYKVKNVYKHDAKAYTQGLFFYDGFLYEATGLKGASTVRKVKLETGEIIHGFAIPKDIFGEGIVLLNNKIIQLSWQAGKGYVYDFETFKTIDQFSYEGEGWGICTDGKKIFMTNGSAEIKILEPQSYSPIKTLQVYDNNGAVVYLNELEYINGFIYANIYQYDKIVKIDPATGKVIAYIDMKNLLPMNDYKRDTDVLNGIAFDKKTNKIFVTGKKWPKLFEVEFVKK